MLEKDFKGKTHKRQHLMTGAAFFVWSSTKGLIMV